MRLKTFITSLSLLIYCLVCTGIMYATVPNEIAYQGRIRENNQLVTGSKDIEIAIFTQETGGSAVYTQAFNNTAVVNGIFNVMLSPNVDWKNGNHWLQTTIAGKILRPRTLITSDFYALHAKTAEGIAVLEGDEINLTVGNSTVVTVTDNQLKIEGRAKDKSGFIMPVGTVISYAGNTIPEGWLECDGRLLTAGQDNNMYRDLFDAIGTSWGGSGESFNIPDLRGMFLRGVDGSAGRDPDKATRTAQTSGGNDGNHVGSRQGYVTRREFVYTADVNNTLAYMTITNENGFVWPPGPGFNGAWCGYKATGSANSTAVHPGGLGWVGVIYSGSGNETRPTNAYVKYIIKY